MEATPPPQIRSNATGAIKDLDAPFRPQPNSVEDTGISFGQLLDLAVKTVYYSGRPSARDISEATSLPFNVVDQLLLFLKREQFVEVVGSSGLGEQEYQYALSERVRSGRWKRWSATPTWVQRRSRLKTTSK